MHNHTALAVDLGAGSGRTIIGTWNGDRVHLRETARFTTPSRHHDGALRWDIHAIRDQVVAGIRAADMPIDTLGIDSWGVDYGLIGENGRLLHDPHHYRDSRTEHIPSQVFANTVSEREMYAITGIQTMPFNTVFQLVADGSTLADASRLLHTPDLVRYLLTGSASTEYTIASTSGLLDASSRDWSWNLIDRLGLPRRIFAPVVQPGEGGVPLDPSFGIDPAPVVLPVASHDTASAVLAVPASDDEWCFISSGTWSLLGVERQSPLLSDSALKAGLSNEGGAFGTIRVLKNIMGLWLLEECRRVWAAAGDHIEYSDLLTLADQAPAFASLFDPDHPSLISPGDMPSRIASRCVAAGESAPHAPASFARAIFEALALIYRATIEQIESRTGRPIRTIHIVGGGSQNTLLCQYAADATGRNVVAGPVEATALGNILMQLHASGILADRDAIRRAAIASSTVTRYTPAADRSAWDTAYARFRRITN